MRSNLPLQMFLYFNWWYTVLYFVITLAIFIYKGACCLASRVRSLTLSSSPASAVTPVLGLSPPPPPPRGATLRPNRRWPAGRPEAYARV
jgi:hypothetical protein